MSVLPLLRAQIEAEVKTRLRSTSTAIAVAAVLVASFLWIPDPASNGVSIAWSDPAGVFTSGIYNSAYVGASASVLGSLFLSLIGFYLVTGSIRRDRACGVGVILAATPLSKTAYLGGKIAAHTVYLWTISLVSLVGGLLVFLRYGVGPLQPLAFLAPWLLFVVPAMVFVAALAVFFDATPGLRGVGGYVVYFFVWSFLLLVLPGLLSGGMASSEGPASVVDPPTTPIYDPIAMGAILQMIATSTPSVFGNVSIGLQYDLGEKLTRIDWPGFEYSLYWVAVRGLTFFWTLVPFGLAWLFFDRFDPARKRGSSRQAQKHNEGKGLAEATQHADQTSRFTLATLPAVHVAPGTTRAILAEAKLLWDGAGWLRFLLPLAALAAAAPGESGLPGAAALLLLLAPALSEHAAREKLAGTFQLILAQPSLPRSLTLWKLAAALVFVLTLGLPRLLVCLVTQPPLALAWLLGLVFVAAFAVAAGALSSGGKLFTGFYVALWYIAINGAPFADFAGALSPAPTASTSAIFAAIGLALIALAWGVERRQTSVA